MPVTYITQNSIGSGTRINSTANDQGYHIGQGVVVGSTDGDAIMASGARTNLHIDGYVGADIRAITTNGDNSIVTISETGRVYSYSGSRTELAVYLAGGDSELYNHGEISAYAGYGIIGSSAGSSYSFVNTGKIEARIPVFMGNRNQTSDSLVNSGLIAANNHLEDSGLREYNNGVYSDGNNTFVTNLAGGQITATAIAGSGVKFGSSSAGGSGTIKNWGEIISQKYWGVDLFAGSTTETTTIENHGTISGGAGALRGSDAVQVVTNSGTMVGELWLQGGDDYLENSGLIDGHIYLSAGDDRYEGEAGVVTNGYAIYLGDGDDEMIGGATRERVFDGSGDDEVKGNGGNDSFRAGSGANFYDGGEGYDYLSYYDFNSRVRIDLKYETTSGGGGGNAASNDRFINIEAVGGTNGGGDTLLGSDARNSLFGWGGDDKLYGRDGNDKLSGGSGDDFLDGGDGTDLLIGGADADTFHFDRGEDNDVITDFENNVDVIEFDNFGFSGVAEALSYASQRGDDVFFDFDGGDSLLVHDVTIAQLVNDIEIV